MKGGGGGVVKLLIVNGFWVKMMIKGGYLVFCVCISFVLVVNESKVMMFWYIVL